MILRLYLKGEIVRKDYLHRIIAEEFLPNPYNMPCVNHRDGCKINNRTENLEWCDYSSNAIHAYKNGLKTSLSGEDSPVSILSYEEVEYIKSTFVKGSHKYGAAALARKLGVSRSCVQSILIGRTWKS